MRPEGRKGKRIRKKFKTKSDAVLYERWVLAQQHNNEWKGNSIDRRPLSVLIDLWWKYHGQLMKSGHNTRLKLLRLSEAMDDPCVHKLNTTMLTELRVSEDRAGDTAQHHKSRDWGVKRDVYRTHLIRPFS